VQRITRMGRAHECLANGNRADGLRFRTDSV
jgi:hypothetical protein